MNSEVLDIYPKYDSYQDSGVDWLGEIPADWQLLKVRNIFRLSNKFAEKNNSHELLSVYTDIGVKPRRELEARGNKASTTDGYLIVEKGDIVVNKLLAWMGAIGYSNYDGVTSPAYDILKPIRPVSSMFYHFLFRTPRCVSELKRNSRGIMDMRLRLYFDKFGNVLVPYPSLEEQEKIISFLNNETAKVDQAIELKQQQIDKLNEYKKITIQNAVTKGLDHTVQMKDSGVDWLGKIPKHWEVMPLKYLIKFHTGGTPDSGNYDYYNGDLPWVTISNLKGRLTKETNNISLKGVRKANIPLTPKGSLLFSFKLSVGQVAFAHEDLYTNEAIATFVPGADIDLDYYYYSLPLFVIHNANTNIYGAKLLNQELIKNAKILSVPKDEQKFIAKYLNEEIFKIDTSVNYYKAQIERLKEYKTILINQAVTGKIKVS